MIFLKKKLLELKQRYPLLGFVLIFLLGQFITSELIVMFSWRYLSIVNSVIICAAILIIFIFNLLIKNFFLNFLLVFILSSSLLLISLPRQNLENLKDSQNIYVEGIVKTRPKRKQSQAVSFIAEVTDVNSQIKFYSLIRSEELPWLNISGIRLYDKFSAILKCKRVFTPEKLTDYSFNLLRKKVNTSCKVQYFHNLWSKNRKSTFTEKLRQIFPQYHALRLEYGLLLSLIFGIDTELTVQTEKNFKRTGLTHLLVFSGAQTSIIYLTVYYILSTIGSIINCIYYFSDYKKYKHILSLIGTFLFCSLIGYESATMRALVACALVMISSIIDTKSAMLYRLILSLAILTVIWPGCFLDPGVQLTYAALIGIWWGTRFKSKVYSYIQMCFAISLLTNLVTALWFQSVSLAGLILNPFLAPLVAAFSVYAGIPAVATVYFFPSLIPYLTEPVLNILSYLESFVFYCSRFQWALFSW